MKIATWNVNSIRTRISHMVEWLEAEAPDIALIQEIKTQEATFPFEPIEDMGYNIAMYGQKSYNGVAIFSKSPLEDVQRGLPNREGDLEARYIEAVTCGVRVASVYVPNGQAVGTEKFEYKLSFMESLTAHLASLVVLDEAVFVGGDYNITVDDGDVYDPAGWHEEVLCTAAERAALRKIFHLGYGDSLRPFAAGPAAYSWWDYRQGSFQGNRGLRIDHILASPQGMDRLNGGGVHKHMRALERPSDHAPVWIGLL